MYENCINQNNENEYNDQLIFANKKLYPVSERAELTKPFFIRKETTFVKQPYPNIEHFIQKCGQNLEDQAEFFKQYFEIGEKQIIEWLTVSNTKVKMIHFNTISKIHITGKSQFQSYYSSFTSFNTSKSNCSIEIFANSHSEFEYCYFHDSKSSPVIVRDFSEAKFKNCIFENNKISVFVSNNSYVEFENCLFINDTSMSIYGNKKSDIKIKNCEFKNVCKALFCKDEVKVRIENSKFDNCQKSAATIVNNSTLMMNNVIVNDSKSTALRAVGNSVIKSQNVSINNTKGNAVNIENASGYFYQCKMSNTYEYPTIAIRGIKSNPIFSKCQIIDNGETFAVVVKNCSRPLFDRCLFTNCESNCFSISDFSMPLIRDCNFINIKKSWLNIYGKSIVTLSGNYRKEKIGISKSSKILNEDEREQEEKNYIVDDIDDENVDKNKSWKPMGLNKINKVDDICDPDEMFKGKLSPLPLISLEKIMKDEEDHFACKCCNHENHKHEDENKEDFYVSAQCGHCFCEKCMNENHKKCPVCDTPVLNMNKVFQEKKCAICLDKAATTVITSCGHMCMCYECAMKCSEQNFKCPLCNQPIVSYRYMFDE